MIESDYLMVIGQLKVQRGRLRRPLHARARREVIIEPT